MEKTNKLIAEFMGVGKHYEAQSSNMFNQYHPDWNRLIPVIDKIDDKILENPKLDCSEKMKDIAIKNDFMDIRYKFSNMEEVYDSVVEFIKYYNNVRE